MVIAKARVSAGVNVSSLGTNSYRISPKVSDDNCTHSRVPLCECQFSSVTQSCLTLCNPMDYSTLGFPVHHQLAELAQTRAHRVVKAGEGDDRG